jgi:hypothetical protein
MEVLFFAILVGGIGNTAFAAQRTASYTLCEFVEWRCVRV